MPIEFLNCHESFGHHVLVGIPLTVSSWFDVDDSSPKHWRLTIRRTAKLDRAPLLQSKKHSSTKYNTASLMDQDLGGQRYEVVSVVPPRFSKCLAFLDSRFT